MLNEILNLEGVAVLSKEQQKSVNGGKGCTLTIQGSDGKWVTRTGICKKFISASMSDSPADMIGQYAIAPSYCETGLGNVPLSSNNGVSRC